MEVILEVAAKKGYRPCVQKTRTIDNILVRGNVRIHTAAIRKHNTRLTDAHEPVFAEMSISFAGCKV